MTRTSVKADTTSAEQRVAELASILATAILRLRAQGVPITSGGANDAQTSLAKLSGTRLTVPSG